MLSPDPDFARLTDLPAFDRFEGGASVRTWLYRITSSRCPIRPCTATPMDDNVDAIFAGFGSPDVWTGR